MTSNVVNKKTKRNLDINKIIFIAAMAILTLIFVIMLLKITTQLFNVRSVEKMDQVTAQDYKSKGTTKVTSYYVFFYNTASDKQEMMDSVLLEYANYAKTHSDARPIYVMDYTSKTNSSVLTDLGYSTTADSYLPGMALINSGSISTKYKTVSEVCNELTSQMGK
jgi:hypothetical protein